jgi:ubiquinone/menaquinone biosynthesis C-methylase UbiE
MAHEKRFAGDIGRLRAPERVERLQVARVTDLCLEGGGLRNVLDVGTGTGLFAEAFAGRGLAVAGVDANAEMIVAAQAYVPTGEFREAPAEALPYPWGAFDLVFLGLLLHESDDAPQVLREARRVARKRVAVLEWAYQESPYGPPLAHRLDPATLMEAIRQAGFAHTETWPLTHLVLYRLTR